MGHGLVRINNLKNASPSANENFSVKQKKFLTIMFVDICSSTKLFINKDPEDVADILDSFFETTKKVVESYGGIINQTLGDGAYIVFGMKNEQALENLIAACTVSQLLHKSFNNFQVRIGIHSGYVVQNSKEKSRDLTVNIVGEAINHAAHLCKAANPGTTVISETSYESVHTLLIANFKENAALRYFEVESIRRQDGIVTVSDTELPFIGRKQELKLLHEAYKQSANLSLHVHIQGDAGIGKTRLISQFINDLNKCNNCKIISYVSLPIAHDTCDVSGSFLQKIKAIFVNTNIDYSFPIKNKNDFQHEKKIKTFYECEEITKICHALSQSYHVLLIFDDLHWKDEERDQILNSLLSNLSGKKILIITTSRREIMTISHYKKKTIYLTSMAKDELRRILSVFSKIDLRLKALFDIVIEKSGKNPYIALQLIRHANRMAQSSSCEFSILEKNMPETLDIMFAQQLENLSEKEKRILWACSVYGMRFNFKVLALITEVDASIIKNILSDLEHKNFIRSLKGITKSYEFMHALAQDSIYRSMRKKDRTELHDACLKHFLQVNTNRKTKIDSLAYHAGQGTDVKKCYAYNFIAAIKSLKDAKPYKSEQYIKTAIRAIKEDSTFPNPRFRLVKCYIQLAKAYAFCGQSRRSLTQLSIAKKEMNLLTKSQYDSMISSFREIELSQNWIAGQFSYKELHEIILEPNIHDIGIKIRAAAMLADLGFLNESNHQLISFAKKLETNSGNQGHLFPAKMVVYGYISKNFADLGSFKEAEWFAKMAYKEACSLDHEPKKIHGLAYSAYYLLKAGKYNEAYPRLQESYNLIQRYGRNMATPFVESTFGYCLSRMKKSLEGAEYICRALEYMNDNGFENRKSLYHLLLGEIYFDYGSKEKAFAEFEIGKECAIKHQENHILAQIHLACRKINNQNKDLSVGGRSAMFLISSYGLKESIV